MAIAVQLDVRCRIDPLVDMHTFFAHKVSAYSVAAFAKRNVVHLNCGHPFALIVALHGQALRRANVGGQNAATVR